MKKLSELSNDIMLALNFRYGDLEVMTKEDYLQSSYFNELQKEPYDEFKVTIADETIATFDLDNIIQYLSDETHDDWFEDVMNEIDQSSEVVKNFVEYVNKIFENNPTYWEGEQVEIDMVREVEE